MWEQGQNDKPIILSLLLTLVTISISFLLPAVSSYDVFGSIYWLFFSSTSLAIGFILLIYGFRNLLRRYMWVRKYCLISKGSKIGILKEEGCKSNATDLSPAYWYKKIQDLGKYRVDYVTFSNIKKEYIALINPYGEVYPEEDYTNLITFNKIRNYVKNGGIFVSPAGVSFWHAWNSKRKRTTPTASEIYSYKEKLHTLATIQQQYIPAEYILEPIFQWGNFSLIDTLTNKAFKLLTTTGDVKKRKVYQVQEDENFCGKIASIERNTEILEFRAAREPLPTSYPMLRADVVDVNGKKRIIYPMIAIPDGKGIFIFSGMTFDYKKNTANKTIVYHQAERVIKSLDYIIENGKILELNALE